MTRKRQRSAWRIPPLVCLLLAGLLVSCVTQGGRKARNPFVSAEEVMHKFFPLPLGSRWIYSQVLASTPDSTNYVEWVPFHLTRTPRGNIQVYITMGTYQKLDQASPGYQLFEQPNVFEYRQNGLYFGVGVTRHQWLTFPVKVGREFQPMPLRPNIRGRIVGFEDLALAVGTFQGCARVEYYVFPIGTTSMEGLEPYYVRWFSPEVGLVREYYTNGSEKSELVAYTIPGVGSNAVADLHIPTTQNLRPESEPLP